MEHERQDERPVLGELARVEHRARAPRTPGGARGALAGAVATLASQRPRHGEVDSGIANGGSSSPSCRPLEPGVGDDRVEGDKSSSAPTKTANTGRDAASRRDGPAAPARGPRAPARRSARTSTAGSTASTPTSDTARSITVTSPKSRSIATSEAISTAKPAIAVTPEASTAAPVTRYVRSQRLDRLPPGLALLAVARAQQDRELGRDRDHQRAQARPTSGSAARRPATTPAPTSPSPARSGPAGTHARSHDRYTANSASATATSPATRPATAAAGRSSRGWRPRPAPAARPASRVTPSGGSSRARMSSITVALRLQRLQPHAEREHGGLAVGRDRRLREVRRHRVQQRAHLLPRRRQLGRAEQIGQRQRGAECGRPRSPSRRCSRARSTPAW